MENQKDKILSCKQIVYVMVFLAFIINVFIPVSMSIAIIDMIQKPANSTIEALSRSYQENETRYEWSETQKNILLSCFYWGFVTEAYGGYLADTWGPKKVFGYGLMLAGIITTLTPVIAMCHFYVLVASRVLLGVVTSGTVTFVMPLASKWIPPTDRTTFLSLTAGDSFGTALSLPLCGYLIWWFGWASVFYVSGTICIMFSCLWLFFIYDSPNSHPRISLQEKERLNLILVKNLEYKNRRPKTVPWGRLLTSKAVWAPILLGASSVQIFYFMLTHLPNYMDAVHKVNIKSNGIYSSLPYIGHFFVSFTCSIIADKMIKTRMCRTLTIRKLFSTSAVLIPSILLGVQTIYGDVKWACVLLFCLILFFKGGVVCCCIANILDVAPNYSGTVVGFGATLATVLTILLNELIRVLTQTHNTFKQWRYILIILMVLNLLSYVFFMFNASDEVQPWNTTKYQEDVQENEKSSQESLPTYSL